MWYSVLLFIKFSTLYGVLSDATYECGDHGRFEYCIDEIPGCVIGCYCHPGYYFDTDSKICEHNSRLIEHHRRNYKGEPTRIQNVVTQNILQEVDSPPTSKIDNQVDAISKDDSDIGDWLYNQFFKTIENQVLNNTNTNDVPSRRSAIGVSIKKPNRTKKWKKERKRNKKSRKKLKKSLLRITEDDSMFDMASQSDSDSSDSSSSGSSLEHGRHEHDEEHGHKKIVVYNKKPKPPLPSFIFLPNLDTPFYPPMGLPPPAVVPMYPIVPVPPVVPFIPNVDCSSVKENTTPTPTSTLSSNTETVTTTTVTTLEATRTESTTVSQESSSAAPNTRANKKKKAVPRISGHKSDLKQNNIRPSNMLSNSRQKLLSRLREKIENPSKKYFTSPRKKDKILMEAIDKDKDEDVESYMMESALEDNSHFKSRIQEKALQEEPSQAIDFKYLTELIHRVDIKNTSDDLPPIEYNPLDSLEIYKPPSAGKQKYSDFVVPPISSDSRRYINPSNKKPDDLYYTKLGREIASMIRGIDFQNRGTHSQFKGIPDIPKDNLFFSQNSPRSYWERSVRSPLSFLKTNKSKFEYLKKSNELLVDIENKVEIVASTPPTLSLQEIENMVNIIKETEKKESHAKENEIKSLVTNYTFDLSNEKETTVSTGNNKMFTEGQILSKMNKKKLTDFEDLGIKTFKIQEIPGLKAWQRSAKNTKLGIEHPKNNFQAIPNVQAHVSNHMSYKMKPQYLNKPITSPLQNNSKRSFLDNNLNSIYFKHKKYFNEEHNFYINQPLLHPEVRQPSYFQAEINNFDYIH